MRNPLNIRPTADPKPSLRERLAGMKAKVSGLGPGADTGRRAVLAGALATTLPLPALAASASTSGEYAEIRARLLAAYAEDRAARPVAGRAKAWSIEDEASILVFQRAAQICAEVLDLPAPQTRDGHGLVAIAAAIMWEASEPHDYQDRGAIAMIRAMLALTETTMPPGFVGFGDEPDLRARDVALYSGAGSLPAWAIAEAEAAGEADEA
jgi:hypothetical protein